MLSDALQLYRCLFLRRAVVARPAQVKGGSEPLPTAPCQTWPPTVATSFGSRRGFSRVPKWLGRPARKAPAHHPAAGHYCHGGYHPWSSSRHSTEREPKRPLQRLFFPGVTQNGFRDPYLSYAVFGGMQTGLMPAILDDSPSRERSMPRLANHAPCRYRLGELAGDMLLRRRFRGLALAAPVVDVGLDLVRDSTTCRRGR